MRKYLFNFCFLLAGLLSGIVIASTSIMDAIVSPFFPSLVKHEQRNESNAAALVRPVDDDSAQDKQTHAAQVDVQGTVTKAGNAELAGTGSIDSQSDAQSLQFEMLKRVNSTSSIADQQHILAFIASANLEQITSALDDIPDDNNRIHEYRWVVGLLIQRYIELDPDAALQTVINAVTSTSGSANRTLASYLLIENYARMQPDSLLAWLENATEYDIRPDDLMGIYSAVAQSKPAIAMDLIMRNPTFSSDRYGGPGMVLYTWSESDPLGALQWLQQHGDEQLSQEHAPGIISQLAYRDLDAARAAAEQFPGLVPDSLFLGIELEALAKSDPYAAFEMARTLPTSEDSMSVMYSVFHAWGDQDPMAAFEFIDSLADPLERQQYADLMYGSISSLASQSSSKSQELLDWTASLSPELQTTVREAVLGQWMESEPEAAIDWVRNQGDTAAQGPLLRSIAWALPDHDLPYAMALFDGADIETQMQLSHGIVNKLHESDPDAAWRWFDGLPDGNVKANALHGLVLTTAQKDPTKALELGRQYMGSEPNGLFQGVLMEVAFEHPAVVENWLASSDVDEQTKAEYRAMLAQLRSDMRGYPPPFEHIRTH